MTQKRIDPRSPNQFSTHIDQEGRVCTACEKYKTWENFKGHKRSHTGRSSKCKECYVSDRKSKGRKKELITNKQRRKYKKKNEPFKYRAQNLRASFMSRHKQENLNRDNIPASNEIQHWLENQPLVCYYSGEELNILKLHVDHKVPLSRGGDSVFDNLCLCSANMNSSKGKMTEEEFVSLLKLLSGFEDGGKYVLARLRMGWRVS